MALKPTLLSETGDWFLQTRLPEFAIDWQDPKGQLHHLEIVGRQLSCQEHNDPLLAGIIHLQQTGGSYRLPGLELQTHWPALFTSGEEFRYLDSVIEYLWVGNLDIQKGSNVYRAAKHISATMIYHLAATKIALRSQQKHRLYRLHLLHPRLPVPRGSDFVRAAHELATRDHLGATALVPQVDLENFFATLYNPLDFSPINYRQGQLPSVRTHADLVAIWKIPSNWPEREAIIDAEIEAASSLAI